MQLGWGTMVRDTILKFLTLAENQMK